MTSTQPHAQEPTAIDEAMQDRHNYWAYTTDIADLARLAATQRAHNFTFQEAVRFLAAHAQEPTESVPETAAPAIAPSPTILARAKRLVAHPNTPMVVGAVLLGALGLVALNKLAPAVRSAVGLAPGIVVFDPVRFVNSQRAAASIMALTPNADTALTLTQVAKQAEAVIKEEAHGAVVLVRQAVVVPGDLTDITERVLERFGLPTTVPTINASASTMSLESVAPTDNAFTSGKLREDYRMELELKSGAAADERARSDNQTKIVP